MDIDINLKFFSFVRTISIRRQWIQYGIIAAVILIAMAAAFWGSTLIMMLLIALPFGIAGIYFSFRQPNLIYILILVGGMFVPFTGPGGVNVSVLGILLLIGIWALDMFVVKREFKFLYTRTIRPLLYFMGISVVAFAVGQISWFPFANQAPMDAQFGGFVIYLILPLIMLITPNLIKDLYWLKIVFWVFIGFSMIYVFARTLELSIADRLFTNAYVANSMLWTWLSALLVSQIIYNHELGWRMRGMLIAFVALVFYVAMVQQNDWKSGWVPPAVAVLALVGLRFKKLTIVAIPFAIAVGIYLAQDLISTDQYSWGTRVDAWLVVLDISRVSPIIGLGFANYYFYAKVFTIRGYHIKFNSHSQFVDLVAQTGILGLLCFFWILFEVGRLAWDLSLRLKDGFARGYVYGVLAGVVGCLMASFLVDWVLPFTYNIGMNGIRASVLPWIFFGGLITIEQVFLSQPQSASSNIRERLLR
jgi:O-Antigen ligase